jgi:hypothetical protein
MRAEKHLENKAGRTVFLENTFNSSILQRDGKMSEEYLNPKVDCIAKRVCNYLDYDMVKLSISYPINVLLILQCVFYSNIYINFELGIPSNQRQRLSLVPCSGRCYKPRDTCARFIRYTGE